MLTLTETFFIGAGVVLVLLGIVEAVAWVGAHKSFLGTVILGEDNRTSTSKTFIFMWTLLVGWALISMLIAGDIIKIHSCAEPPMTITMCLVQKDEVGLLQIGWKHFVSGSLPGSYLVLLGIPAAAGVAAKAITQSKTDTGTLIKTTASGKQSVASRVAQIFSADDQTTDLGDFQYMIFNLVTAVYFVTQFVQPSTQGLPPIPDTLLGLTSVSAALYVGKKAATRTQPTITGVFPSNLRVGAQAVITGSGLTADPAAAPPAGAAARVTFNGIESPAVQSDPVAGSLKATVPPDAVPASGPDSISGTVQVRSAYGAVTPGYTVQLSR